MAERQVKSRQRVADHGEVFTAEREVKAMCDLVKQNGLKADFWSQPAEMGIFLRKFSAGSWQWSKVVMGKVPLIMNGTRY
mgnify:CR=1 FL=1